MPSVTACPACAERLELPDGMQLDSKYRCPQCHADLVVIQADPLELDWDDWDDDDDADADWDR